MVGLLNKQKEECQITHKKLHGVYVNCTIIANQPATEHDGGFLKYMITSVSSMGYSSICNVLHLWSI